MVETKIYEIDPITRVINIPSATIIGVESDEKAERIHFTCDRFVGNNLDLYQFNLFVNYQNAKGEKNAYLIEDVQADDSKISFSWELSRQVTKYKGFVKFIICARKSGDLTNEWNTKVASATVIEGLEVEEAINNEITRIDLLEQILSRIPSDYSELINKVNEQSSQIAKLDSKVNALELGGVSEDTVKQAIKDYLDKNGVSGGLDLQELEKYLVDNGYVRYVDDGLDDSEDTPTFTDTNTTYTFKIENNQLVITDSNGVITNLDLPQSSSDGSGVVPSGWKCLYDVTLTEETSDYSFPIFTLEQKEWLKNVEEITLGAYVKATTDETKTAQGDLRMGYYVNYGYIFGGHFSSPGTKAIPKFGETFIAYNTSYSKRIMPNDVENSQWIYVPMVSTSKSQTATYTYVERVSMWRYGMYKLSMDGYFRFLSTVPMGVGTRLFVYYKEGGE